MIIARTPFRISFFGGGTDFPEFFRQHGGAVLCSTINKYCYLSVHHLAPLFKHRFRAGYSRTESVLKPSEFMHPLIRETLLYLDQQDGVEIGHTADLPGQTGLGSSSAFTVGLLNALHAFRNDRVDAEDLAREAVHVERDRVGDTGGWQDQYAAAYGGFRLIRFGGNNLVHVESIGVTAERLRELERHLLLFFTGTESSAEQILREQKARLPQNAQTLMNMLKMVDEASLMLAGSSSLLDFGKLLHEAWMMKRSLSSGISNAWIDEAYEAARSAGGLGGKLLGAGGRGFLLVFADPADHQAIKVRLSSLQSVDFCFSFEGSRIIFKTSE